MDDRQFRKHVADMVHGHHHPEEHDWGEGTVRTTGGRRKSAASAAGKRKRAKARHKK